MIIAEDLFISIKIKFIEKACIRKVQKLIYVNSLDGSDLNKGNL